MQLRDGRTSSAKVAGKFILITYKCLLRTSMMHLPWRRRWKRPADGQQMEPIRISVEAIAVERVRVALAIGYRWTTTELVVPALRILFKLMMEKSKELSRQLVVVYRLAFLIVQMSCFFQTPLRMTGRVVTLYRRGHVTVTAAVASAKMHQLIVTVLVEKRKSGEERPTKTQTRTNYRSIKRSPWLRNRLE